MKISIPNPLDLFRHSKTAPTPRPVQAEAKVSAPTDVVGPKADAAPVIRGPEDVEGKLLGVFLPAADEVSANEDVAAPAAEESTMSTAATPVGVAATAPKKENGFERFIDKIGALIEKAEPIAEKVAEDAEPLLALTQFGPEYDLVLNAILGAKKTAVASLAAGTSLTGTQQMSLVLQASTPALTAILASKGIKEPTAVEQAISEFAQNVYNFQTGPAVVTAS